MRVFRLLLSACTVVLICGLTTTSSAQFTVGLTVAPGNSTISGDNPPDAKFTSTNGLLVGVVAEYGITADTRISFQPSFQQAGATIAFDVPGTEETVDSIAIDLTYIHLPLLARVATEGGRWYVTGGPFVGLLQSAEGTLAQQGGDVVDVSDEVTSTDVGAIFGIGHMFPLDPVKLSLEFRWIQGLSNISARDDGSRRWNKARHLHFGILYSFGK